MTARAKAACRSFSRSDTIPADQERGKRGDRSHPFANAAVGRSTRAGSDLMRREWISSGRFGKLALVLAALAYAPGLALTQEPPPPPIPVPYTGQVPAPELGERAGPGPEAGQAGEGE